MPSLLQATLKTLPIQPLKNHQLTGLLLGMVIGITSFYTPMTNAAAIYKVVDEKTGQVTFTDRPQNYEQQVGKQISQTSVMTGSDSVGTNSSNQTDNVSNPPSYTAQNPHVIDANNSIIKAPIKYQLTMTEPNEERAYRRPSQSIEVSLQLKPALQEGDSVVIYLDGNEVAQSLNASIATVDIMPGTHTLRAVVKNEKGQTVKQADRTIYVIQNTQTLQHNKKITQQLLAYQRLPWHQKVLLKMRQKDGNLQQTESSQPTTNDVFTKKVGR